MTADLDNETKLKVYMLIVNRYKELISEKEERSVSETRQRVSPYNDLVKSLRDRLLSDFHPYSYERDFMQAVQRAVGHVGAMKTFRMLIPFWMTFEEMEELKIGGVMDKAILLASLLRAFDSRDARVMVTKSGRPLVGFEWKGERHIVLPESGSILNGDDAAKLVAEDPLAYAFSDLVYESYEEEG